MYSAVIGNAQGLRANHDRPKTGRTKGLEHQLIHYRSEHVVREIKRLFEECLCFVIVLHFLVVLLPLIILLLRLTSGGINKCISQARGIMLDAKNRSITIIQSHKQPPHAFSTKAGYPPQTQLTAVREREICCKYHDGPLHHVGSTGQGPSR